MEGRDQPRRRALDAGSAARAAPRLGRGLGARVGAVAARAALVLCLAPGAGTLAAQTADDGRLLAQASAPLRVVLLPGRSSASLTSGRGRLVLERQNASLTRILRGEPGVVLTYSPDSGFGANPRLGERLENVWADEFTGGGRLDVARARSVLRPQGTHVAVGLFYDEVTTRTTVHALDVESGKVFQHSAPAQVRPLLDAFKRAFDSARAQAGR